MLIVSIEENGARALTRPVAGVGLLVSVLASSSIGVVVGFAAGLVPGLHMNNIAAAVSAYTGLAAATLALIGHLVSPTEVAIVLACFVSAAMVAHLFACAIPSTYVGVPAEDVVSVLPAHRLAKAGLGRVAVVSSADGSLGGIVLSVALLVPMCLLMGPPFEVYRLLRVAMLPIIVVFTAILLLSEGHRHRCMDARRARLVRVVKGLVVFASSGILGFVVLKSGYCSSIIPDFPWMTHGFVPKSSLLLPMFAGLFGIPGLILSLGSRSVVDLPSMSCPSFHHSPSSRDLLVSVFGGTIVGWMPGMTSGSAVTLCSPRTQEVGGDDSIASAAGFIWLYSAISSSGAVFAVGALFTIMHARSGSMDAIASLMGMQIVERGFLGNALALSSIALSMVISSMVCHHLLMRMSGRLAKVRWLLTSRALAACSLLFVCALTVYLTGSRGALLMATAVPLGLIPPLTGVRRIQLMGCLLLPLMITLAGP